MAGSDAGPEDNPRRAGGPPSRLDDGSALVELDKLEAPCAPLGDKGLEACLLCGAWRVDTFRGVLGLLGPARLQKPGIG